ncbi:unnamed protein product [Linum trigynum]|uniref:Transposase n=1 Tax=Linum trigynum TaxID=586398 RepID=A0AAV2FEA1_9ROSI
MWHKCLLCSHVIKGGVINRVKQHLAGRKGDGSPCPQVTHDIQVRFRALLDECLKKEWAKDPIDYEQLDNIDFWIVEEDPPADIDYEELEKTLYEEEEEEQGSSSSSNKRPRVEEDFEYDITDEIDFDISHLVDAMEMEMDSFIFED